MSPPLVGRQGTTVYPFRRPESAHSGSFRLRLVATMLPGISVTHPGPRGLAEGSAGMADIESEESPRMEHESAPAMEHESQPAMEHESQPAMEHESEPAMEHESEPAMEHESNP